MQMGFQIILGLIQGIINALPTLLKNLPTIIMAIINFFTLTKFLSLGKTVVSGLWSGIKGMIGGLKGNISGLVKNIISWFKNGFSSIGDVGKNLVKGLWNGIKNVKNWILNKIKGFGKSILNSMKDFFGIHSPSTEFAWIGKMNILGLEEGMEDNISDLNKTIDKTISFDYSGLDYLTNGFDNYSRGISNSVYGTNILNNTSFSGEIVTLVNLDGELVGRGVTPYVAKTFKTVGVR